MKQLRQLIRQIAGEGPIIDTIQVRNGDMQIIMICVLMYQIWGLGGQ